MLVVHSFTFKLELYGKCLITHAPLSNSKWANSPRRIKNSVKAVPLSLYINTIASLLYLEYLLLFTISPM